MTTPSPLRRTLASLRALSPVRLVRAATASLAILAGSLAAVPACAADNGPVLVVLSSADQLQLRNDKTYHTGFYLDELAIPLRKIVEAGFTPVFANPKGQPVTYDPVSNDRVFFGGDDVEREKALKFVESHPAFQRPKTLAAVLKEGTSQYKGIFIPGGHAPCRTSRRTRPWVRS